jgi:hypothetical protein
MLRLGEKQLPERICSVTLAILVIIREIEDNLNLALKEERNSHVAGSHSRRNVTLWSVENFLSTKES